MPTVPYRDPGSPLEPLPAPPPDVGSMQSAYAPPPFLDTLVAPVLFSGIGVGFALGILQLSTGLALAFGAVLFAAFAWEPMRVRDVAIDLHSNGLVLHRGATSVILPFAEVNELWFDLYPIHLREGAYLRSLRLVDFAGNTHRVPLALVNGTRLMEGILRGSTGLLMEARRALAHGSALAFGRVQIDRAAVTIDGASLLWRDVRLARISPARVVFFARGGLLAWRKIHLQRIPNPHLLISIVEQLSPKVDRDGALLGSELDKPTSEEPGLTGASVAAARSKAASGAFTVLLGLAVTFISVHTSVHIVAWGAIVFGAAQVASGLRRS